MRQKPSSKANPTLSSLNSLVSMKGTIPVRPPISSSVLIKKISTNLKREEINA